MARSGKYGPAKQWQSDGAHSTTVRIEGLGVPGLEQPGLFGLYVTLFCLSAYFGAFVGRPKGSQAQGF